ncbi:cytoplasmic phosphatidylinositol transfer protein 1b isoform X1 [Anguilla rostrata]|uniref:cytoplasmic phosphatidylinositol transfer protein 1b isoform X1 n=1 Tax=Anguilla rostrata TaxID=7938 RepID=UPI0030CEF499
MQSPVGFQSGQSVTSSIRNLYTKGLKVIQFSGVQLLFDWLQCVYFTHRTHTHTRAHTHTHARTHTYMHIHTHRRTCTHTQTHTQGHPCMHTQTHTRSYTQKEVHAHTETHACTHRAHTHTPTRTFTQQRHTFTHTHTHTQTQMCLSNKYCINPCLPQDLSIWESKKTGRGPLLAGWRNNSKPIMCSYKRVQCSFEVYGLQGRTEEFIHKNIRDILLVGHRQAVAWTDEWHGMSLEEVREFERELQEQTNSKLKSTQSSTDSATPPRPAFSRSISVTDESSLKRMGVRTPVMSDSPPQSPMRLNSTPE